MKTQLEEFDLVILGGGTGSTIAAWTFGGEGKQVAVFAGLYSKRDSAHVEHAAADRQDFLPWPSNSSVQAW